MSNRKKTAFQRMQQSYRNARRRAAEKALLAPDVPTVVKRSGGPFNFPYGARPGAKTSVLNLVKNREVEATLTYETMTRDALRSLAKHKGVEGWHKMNKAALVEAVSE